MPGVSLTDSYTFTHFFALLLLSTASQSFISRCPSSAVAKSRGRTLAMCS